MATAIALLLTAPAAFSAPAARDGGGTYFCALASPPLPTIDGTMVAGEWSDANISVLTLNGFSNPTNTMSATWYFMNDGNALYIALSFASATDFLVLDMDDKEDHGARDGGEDYVRVDAGYSDRYWSQSNGDWYADTGAGGTSDGAGKRSASTLVYEVMKPLSSGDARDLSAAPGSTIGFRIETYSGGDFYRFPQNTVDHDLNFNGNLGDEMAAWMDLWLADAPNTAPTLDGGGVSPATGNVTASFAYSVTYTDADNNTPSCASVVIDGAAHPMLTADTGYADGSAFTFSTKLKGGTHTYAFNFSDGRIQVRLPASGSYSGPEVELPVPPTLSEGEVSPLVGTPATTFIYSVRYNDSNGDPPIIRKLYIDGVSRDMATSGTDLKAGVVYTYETTLLAGAHTYRFMFGDQTGNANLPPSGSYEGPAVAFPNEAPIFNQSAQKKQIPEDAVSYFDLYLLFQDPDGDPLEFTYLGGASNNLTVEVAPNGSAVLRPARDYYAARETLRFLAADPLGANCSGELDVTILNVNDPPYLLMGGMQPDPREAISINESESIAFVVTAADIDNRTSELTYTWLVDNEEKAKFGTAAYSWRPTYGDAGAHAIKARISDGLAYTDATWNVTVHDTNRPPEIAEVWPVNNTEVAYGARVDFCATANDPDGDALTFIWKASNGTLLRTQSGVKISSFSRSFSGSRLHIIVLEVQDGRGGSMLRYIHIALAASFPPTAIIDAPNSAGQGKGVQFSGLRSLDPDGSIVRYSWDFGDGTAGEGANVTHVYKKAKSRYTVTLTVTDDANVTGAASFNISIKAPADSKPGFIPGPGGALLAAAAAAVIALGRRKRGMSDGQ